MGKIVQEWDFPYIGRFALTVTSLGKEVKCPQLYKDCKKKTWKGF